MENGTDNEVMQSNVEDDDDVTTINTASPVVDDADGHLEMARAMMDPTQAEAERESRKPDISWLEDAVATLEDGTVVPLFNVGDSIVIEQYATLLKNRPWLDTQTYIVRSIDDETGIIKLWNPVLEQQAMNNFITGPKDGGCVFKLAPSRGSIGSKKRGRSSLVRKNHPDVKAEPETTDKPKRRGRPKGTKNRSKEVIAEEKARVRKEREAKAARKNKKRI
jgi:hypothetical protein